MPFIIGSIIDFLLIFIITILIHTVPVIASEVDTPDIQFSVCKLMILLVGVMVYFVLNVVTCVVSMKCFNKTDL